MESITGYLDSLEDNSELPPPGTMSRAHDSARSTYVKHDSGFITNSSLSRSRDGSPTRDSIMRKNRSHSPSVSKYVLERYKSPAIESMRNHTLISTFEDMEIEKLILKDENADMKDKVYQFQSTMRQLETSRIRDAERFDLQEREVNALRVQLKAEKEGRQSVMSLAEELQSDLTRKSDLLAIANEELIETRERLRVLDKQLHEEGNNRSHIERTVREHREKLEDVNTELEMEKKLRKASLENIRELKEQIAQIEDELNMYVESIKDVARLFESSITNNAKPNLRLRNEEAEEKLYRVMKIRDDLCEKVISLQKDVTSKTTQSSDLSDEILNIARILRSEVKDDVDGNTLLGDVVFREQRTAVSNARVSPAMEPLQMSLTMFLEHEIKKRAVLRQAVDGCLKKFTWRGTTLNETQLIPMLNAILVSWSTYREHRQNLYSRLTETRKKVAAVGKTATESVMSTRTVMANFKNLVLVPSRHRLDEDLYRFIEATKSKHEAVRRFLEASHQTRFANETSKARSDHEAKLADAVEVERQRIQQLEKELSVLHSSLKGKEEYSLKLLAEVRETESRLFRQMEETRQLQKDHSLAVSSAGQQQSVLENAFQIKMKVIEGNLEEQIEKLKRDLDQRAKTIALLDESILAKDQRVAKIQAKLKEEVKKHEAVVKELAIEKDPSKNQKLLVAIKAYEREISELRAKLTERDTLVTHLKKRVDEALNRGQKKMNEAAERNRAELVAKEAKFSEKEKEVEKLQDQLTRLSRVVSKSTLPANLIPAGSDTSRSTVLSAGPTVRNLTNVRSVSGADTTRLPPILPAGMIGGDPSSNGQLSRRTTARAEVRSQNPTRRARTQSTSRSNA